MDRIRPDQGFHQLDHTADLAIEFWAPTEEALLEEGARALVHILTDGVEVEEDSEGHLVVEAMDPEDRLVRWLNEILFAASVEGFLFSSGTFTLHERGVDATVRGQSDARGLLATELKSVTYHDLRLQRHAHGWYAHVVVDV